MLKSVAWTNRVTFPGIYNVSNGFVGFGCLASLDGPLVSEQSRSFSHRHIHQTIHHLGPFLSRRILLTSREGEETLKHVFMEGLGGCVCERKSEFV